MTGAQLLTAYKYQPNLEKRNAQLKGTQLVAPMFLRDPARIEGLLCCHFIAMLIQALIERTIRTAMADRGLTELSLYDVPPISWTPRRLTPMVGVEGGSSRWDIDVRTRPSSKSARSGW
jgi:hypothetical protein